MAIFNLGSGHFGFEREIKNTIIKTNKRMNQKEGVQK